MTNHTASNSTTESPWKEVPAVSQRPCIIHVLLINPPPMLGLTLQSRKKQLYLTGGCCLPNSVLHKTPLRPGDVLVRVNGVGNLTSTKSTMELIRKQTDALELTVVDYSGDRTLRSTTIIVCEDNKETPSWSCGGGGSSSQQESHRIQIEPERDYWVLTSLPRPVQRWTRLRVGSECVRVNGKRPVEQEYTLSSAPTTFETRLSRNGFLSNTTMRDRIDSCCESCGHCCYTCCMDMDAIG